jgi:uncharacterized protein
VSAESGRAFSGGPLAVIERLLRGGDRAYFDLFEQSAETAVRAAQLLERLLSDNPGSDTLTEEIAGVRARRRRRDPRGDETAERVVRGAGSIARNIIRLASAHDDITDFIDETANYLTLYRVEAPMTQAQQLGAVLVEATRQLVIAIRRMSRVGSFDNSFTR